jgi:WD40 repeat protein
MRLVSTNSGFGKVYEAYNGATPKILKVLKEAHNQNSRVIELFQQEAAVLSQLNHPGIPRVEQDGYFQFFPKNRDEPVHCIIMEKIDGPDLKQWMKQQGNHPITEKQALNWLKQLAEILHLVHQKNYFHRDIKPTNIMLRSTGQLVLIDFGTARELTETYLADVGGAGSVTKISSAGYTPPEQEKGYAVPQSDFYSLGRTFVYLLTGKQATDPEIYDPSTDRCNWRDRTYDISGELANFIDKLMAPTAAARPKNTQEVLDEVAKISQELSQPSSEKNVVVQATNQQALTQQSINVSVISETAVKPKKKWILGGAVALILGLGGYGFWLFSHSSSPNFIAQTNLSSVKTLKGHTSFVNSLAISPDGQILVSASADRTIKIWELAKGKELHTLRGHTSFVNYLTIGRDGQKLFSGGADNSIKIWNLTTGQAIGVLNGHTSFVNYLKISHDGQKLFSASADNTIKIWNIAAGKAIHTLKGHTSSVNSLAISPDDRKLFSASADMTIKIWDISTGRELGTFKGHTSSVNSLEISPDGQKLFSASADKTIKIWDISTNREIRTLEDSSFVNYLAVSNEGQRLLSSNADKTIKIWNLSTGQVSRTFTGPSKPINYFAISPDWQTIATGSGDNAIEIWRMPQ